MDANAAVAQSGQTRKQYHLLVALSDEDRATLQRYTQHLQAMHKPGTGRKPSKASAMRHAIRLVHDAAGLTEESS